MKATLTMEIEFDETSTDAEAVAKALDSLLDTALSTPGILDDVGGPTIGIFGVVPHPLDSQNAQKA